MKQSSIQNIYTNPLGKHLSSQQETSTKKKQTITKKLKKIVYNTSNKYKEFYKSFKEGEDFTLCFSAITNSNMRGSSDYKYL